MYIQKMFDTIWKGLSVSFLCAIQPSNEDSLSGPYSERKVTVFSPKPSRYDSIIIQFKRNHTEEDLINSCEPHDIVLVNGWIVSRDESRWCHIVELSSLQVMTDPRIIDKYAESFENPSIPLHPAQSPEEDEHPIVQPGPSSSEFDSDDIEITVDHHDHHSPEFFNPRTEQPPPSPERSTDSQSYTYTYMQNSYSSASADSQTPDSPSSSTVSPNTYPYTTTRSSDSPLQQPVVYSQSSSSSASADSQTPDSPSSSTVSLNTYPYTTTISSDSQYPYTYQITDDKPYSSDDGQA